MWDKANVLLTRGYSNGCSTLAALYNRRVGENHPNMLKCRNAAQRLLGTFVFSHIHYL